MVPIIEIDRHVLPALPLQVETEGAGQPKVGGGSHSYTSTVPCASWSIRERFVRFGIERVCRQTNPRHLAAQEPAVWPVAIRPTGGSQRFEEGGAQEVADEPLEGRGPRAHLAAVGPRVVAVHERAAQLVAPREELRALRPACTPWRRACRPGGARHGRPTLAWRVPRGSWKARAASAGSSSAARVAAMTRSRWATAPALRGSCSMQRFERHHEHQEARVGVLLRERGGVEVVVRAAPARPRELELGRRPHELGQPARRLADHARDRPHGNEARRGVALIHQHLALRVVEQPRAAAAFCCASHWEAVCRDAAARRTEAEVGAHVEPRRAPPGTAPPNGWRPARPPPPSA